MSVSRDIAAMYRGPGRVVARFLANGPREDRALAYLMGACGLMFIAQMPPLARRAHVTGEDLNMLLGGALLAWLFIAPLFFYVLAWFAHLVARLLGGSGAFWSARLALFWALLAAAPLMLLLGLVGGFIGSGVEQRLVFFGWLGAFLWFWGAGLWQAERGLVA